jgi:hypothetical protein
LDEREWLLFSFKVLSWYCFKYQTKLTQWDFWPSNIVEICQTLETFCCFIECWWRWSPGNIIKRTNLPPGNKGQHSAGSTRLT